MELNYSILLVPILDYRLLKVCIRILNWSIGLAGGQNVRYNPIYLEHEQIL
jgi:hypothetical protein